MILCESLHAIVCHGYLFAHLPHEGGQFGNRQSVVLEVGQSPSELMAIEWESTRIWGVTPFGRAWVTDGCKSNKLLGRTLDINISNLKMDLQEGTQIRWNTSAYCLGDLIELQKKRWDGFNDGSS